jgi:glycosyltransferase involved in cell wall biosynthesis
MRGMVVTLLPPPDPARDQHGIYRRLGMFLSGLKEVCEVLEIVHFARAQEMMAPVLDASAVSSAFWGMPVEVHTVPLNLQPRSWWQVGSAPFTLRYRRDFRPYLGSDQADALGRIIDTSNGLIFVHRLPAMAALLQLRSTRSPIFFDLDDLEHRVKWRAAQTATTHVGKIRNLLEIPALLAIERRAISRAAGTFVCSALDRTILSELRFDVSRTLVVPNAAEIPEVRPRLSSCQSVLYLGNYGHAPNAEAAERLITRVWPRLRARAEFATLIIAGRHPDCIPSYHCRPPNVEFTGFVSDLDALYARARIVCCPIRNGGGTRLKLIEAAAYGKPIVASPVAVEGLEFNHGRDVLVHEPDDALALACARLLQDDALAEALAASAHQKARSLYSLADLPRQIADELRAGLASHAVPPSASDGTSGIRFRHQFDRELQFPTTSSAKRESR